MEKETPAQTLILCHLVEQEDQHRLVPSALINPYCRCILDGLVSFRFALCMKSTEHWSNAGHWCWFEGEHKSASYKSGSRSSSG